DVDHFGEQRQPPAAVIERAIGAQIEPRVFRQPDGIAGAADEQSTRTLVEVARDGNIAAEPKLRADARLRRQPKSPVSGEGVPLIEVATERLAAERVGVA